MNESRGHGRPGFQLATLAIALALGMAGRALGADELDAALSRAGKVWYEKYCTSCHGPDGTPGSAISSATKQPVDLRTYVKRNGGKFPAAAWLQVVADVRPGGPHAPVWESIQRDQSGVAQDAAARGVLGQIARYVNSIQKK